MNNFMNGVLLVLYGVPLLINVLGMISDLRRCYQEDEALIRHYVKISGWSREKVMSRYAKEVRLTWNIVIVGLFKSVCPVLNIFSAMDIISRHSYLKYSPVLPYYYWEKRLKRKEETSGGKENEQETSGGGENE